MNLVEKIEELRRELNKALVSGISEAREVLELSQKLDILIVEYQKKLSTKNLLCV